MIYAEFLNYVIDDGIEAARADYTTPLNKLKLDGSIRGFEECRGRDPKAIFDLLEESQSRTRTAMHNQADDYWYWRCRTLEIEWVANVISAMRLNQGLPFIVKPTARGAQKAAEILGVAPAG